MRLKNPSANKGKSGGFRVVYYVHVEDQIFMISVYAKGEQVDISHDKIRAMIEEALQEASDDPSEEEKD